MSRLDDLDYYTLMGVPDGAPLPEIKRAFREFARRYHPDNFAGLSAAKIEQATIIYRRGSEAYQVLTDEKLRAAYDITLSAGTLRMTAEEMDRALAPTPAPEKKSQLPIETQQALTQYKAGIQAAHQGDWRTAWRHLKEAHELEPDNEFIASRYYRVERKLRRRGPSLM